MPPFFRLLYFLARIGSQFDFGHLRYTTAAVAFTFLHMSWSRRLNVYNAYLVVRTSTQNSNDKYQYHQSEPQSGCSQRHVVYSALEISGPWRVDVADGCWPRKIDHPWTSR